MGRSGFRTLWRLAMLHAPLCTPVGTEETTLVKSNICWGVGVWGMEEELFWALVEQMPRMPGGDQLPLQIRALNYKVFTNANSWGKSSALICVMVSVTGD